MIELQEDLRVVERKHLQDALADAAKHLDNFETQVKLIASATRYDFRSETEAPFMGAAASRRPIRKTRSYTMAFAALAIFISGYATSVFGILERWPVRFGQQHRLDILALDLASARDETGLRIAREKAAENAALEAKRIADANGNNIKRALDEKTAQLVKISEDLALARDEIRLHVSREKVAEDAALEAKRIADANVNNIKQSLDEKAAQLDKISGNLAAEIYFTSHQVDDARAETLRVKQISEINERKLRKIINENVSRVEELQRELSARIGSNNPSPNQTEVSPSPVTDPTRRPVPMIAISSVDEANLLARAQSFLEKSDIPSARLLLEYGKEKGSISATFMLAGTYEEPDRERAIQLYELAEAGGMQKARERLEILRSGSRTSK
jgi:hypothetical protein